MATVALETSTREPSVALELGGRLREERLSGDRPHASDLMPALRDLLSAAEVAPAEVEVVVVGTGPGSYTGLRVGVATALGLARGSGAQLTAVPSVEALVWSECESGEEAGVLLDARAGELYFAHYRREADGVHAVRAPCVVSRAEAAALVPRELALFADETAPDVAGIDASARRVRPAIPRARAVLELGLLKLRAEGPLGPSQVEPLYLRAFAAKPRKR